MSKSVEISRLHKDLKKMWIESFPLSKIWKNVEKSSYAQSYPHYPHGKACGWVDLHNGNRNKCFGYCYENVKFDRNRQKGIDFYKIKIL